MVDAAPEFAVGRPLVMRAYRFAACAHAGMRRKGGAPFLEHPVGVARLLAAAGYRDEVLAAALLHDVVEDTPHTIDEIRDQFGEQVAALVAAVTEDDRIFDVFERKRAYRVTVQDSGPEAAAICCADKTCNYRDLAAAYARIGEQLALQFSSSLDALEERGKAELAMLQVACPDCELLEPFERALDEFIVQRHGATA